MSITAAHGDGGRPGDGGRRDDRGACTETDLQAAAAHLEDALGDRLGRFIVTVRSSPAETAVAVDGRTDEVAADLRRAGAVLAQPIAGQPLVVVEVSGSQLRQLAEDPRIVCIERDTADPPTR